MSKLPTAKPPTVSAQNFLRAYYGTSESHLIQGFGKKSGQRPSGKSDGPDEIRPTRHILHSSKIKPVTQPVTQRMYNLRLFGSSNVNEKFRTQQDVNLIFGSKNGKRKVGLL